MLDLEAAAADAAIQSGMYATWRSMATGTDCTRVGPGARCFCGHPFKEHNFVSKKAIAPRCGACACARFAFVPQRPEEVGDWHQPRRKGFNVHTWRAKCRCGHAHDAHDPGSSRRCHSCGCGMFESNFACLVCDRKWEDHETLFETTQERIEGGRTVGDAFRPLSDDADLRGLVFPGQGGAGAGAGVRGSTAASASGVRPPQVGRQFAEKSVQIMHANSGGVARDTGVANSWGKVDHPPEEFLFQPPSLGGAGMTRGAKPSASGGSGSRIGGGGAGASVAGVVGTRLQGNAAALGAATATASRTRGALATPTTRGVAAPPTAASRARPPSQQAPQQVEQPKTSSGFRAVYD
ncbi:hypothetical protein FOA52_005277 [Chlamydomonas sp. UWO 241]|nr:hypothetical protein FOA52_005277 [Chlamydomonas sp. UWO 241]